MYKLISMKRYYLIFLFLIATMSLAAAQGLLKTSLEITVRNTLGNTVEGVEVKLYKDYKDFESETNEVTEMLMTDNKGKVLFKGLESMPYYVSAVKGDENNFGDGEMVNELIENRKNKVTIIIR